MPSHLEPQDHSGQAQGLSERKKFAQWKKYKTAFRFGKIAAVNSSGHFCQLGLTDTAALAQASKELANPARELIVFIF